MKKRIKHNDLLPYFIDDERNLAKRRAYVASCEKFFDGLQVTSKGGPARNVQGLKKK